MHDKLFIPGPVEVSEQTLRAMSTPLIGHRSPEFVSLYETIQPLLQDLFYTNDPVYLGTSSAWGAMEGALRNVSSKRILNCTNGAFSEKWHSVALRCGKKATALCFDWGSPVHPEKVHQALSSGHYDAITLVHNETSTGTTSPLLEIMTILKEFPKVISVVDVVSSFSVEAIPKDQLGIDVMIASSQKALALPPGLTLFSVSKRAHERAATVPGRGYYFDFLEFQKNHERSMTPTTPAISLIYALRSKLQDIQIEGKENRYRRYAYLNALVHKWIKKQGFRLFPPVSFASKGLSCIANTRNIPLEVFQEKVKKQFHYIIDGGYGKIKGKTFRISNMGDETEETLKQLLSDLDIVLQLFPS